MLTLYHSNRLDDLKQMLVHIISVDPLTDPLDCEQILVQSPGMARWLQLQLAEAFGIAASLEFPLPASFIWKMFVEVLDDVPERSAFAKDSMTWKLMDMLPQWLEDERFAPLRRYLTDDDDQIRRYQLAGKVADIFDQYLVYRPEWIQQWEAGNDLPELTADQPWQPVLWRALVARTAELNQSHWHRANMHQAFAAALADGSHNHKLPKRLFVFGISALPPGYLHALQALGEQCHVHLMVTNPCRYYWGDIRDARYLARVASHRFREGMSPDSPDSLDDTGHPLLASMGKLGRDYLWQLQELGANEIDAFTDAGRGSLLQHLHQDILDLDGQREESPVIGKEDHSLSLHGCHSPLREVEVLHDNLLAMFQRNPALTPRDIIVMVPDVDTYAPFIQAVFGSAHQERYIPFALSDRSASQEHPILTAFQRLLTLDQSRASAPELLELLEVQAVQHRFGLTADSLTTLNAWIDDAGIRWGLNEQHQSHFDIPTREQNTWLFGLRRLLLGYAMPSEQGLFNNILASDLVQGMEAELAGRLADFIEQCEWLLPQLEQARTTEQWIIFLNQLLERFFSPDDQDEQALQSIRKALDNIRSQLDSARFHEPLSRAVMAEWLQEHLGSSRNSQRFLAGQVNFCTLMPMRSIPFKVVCLLGMNDSAYPRSLPPMGFDLMAGNARRGDRSRREDDRYLFLEALLSAREALYISYISRNVRDNSESFPSVLVTELYNLINDRFQTTSEQTSVVEQLFTQHPLQAFSPNNFSGNKLPRSFAREWLPAARGEGQAATPFCSQPLSADTTLEQLPLAQLLAFWQNPCQAFCQQRLKVFFDDQDHTPETREPFAVDGLTGWTLKRNLTRDYMNQGNSQSTQEQIRASGALPHGHFGELTLAALDNEARALAELVGPWLKNKMADDLELRQDLKDSCLTGWLDSIHNHGQVFWRTGKLRAPHRFSAWIQHLCYCAAAPQPGPTVYLTNDVQFRLRPVTQEQAVKLLCALETGMQRGLTQPLPLFQETAWAWLKEVSTGLGLSADKADQEKAETKAHKAFDDTGFGMAEGSNSYIRRCFPELDPVMTPMTALAELYLLPLLSHYEEFKAEEQQP